MKEIVCRDCGEPLQCEVVLNAEGYEAINMPEYCPHCGETFVYDNPQENWRDNFYL